MFVVFFYVGVVEEQVGVCVEVESVVQGDDVGMVQLCEYVIFFDEFLFVVFVVGDFQCEIVVFVLDFDVFSLGCLVWLLFIGQYLVFIFVECQCLIWEQDGFYIVVVCGDFVKFDEVIVWVIWLVEIN